METPSDGGGPERKLDPDATSPDTTRDELFGRVRDQGHQWPRLLVTGGWVVCLFCGGVSLLAAVLYGAANLLDMWPPVRATFIEALYGHDGARSSQDDLSLAPVVTGIAVLVYTLLVVQIMNYIMHKAPTIGPDKAVSFPRDTNRERGLLVLFYAVALEGLVAGLLTALSKLVESRGSAPSVAGPAIGSVLMIVATAVVGWLFVLHEPRPAQGRDDE